MKLGFVSGFIVVGFRIEAQEPPAKEESLFPDKEFYTREEVAALQSALQKRSDLLEQDIGTQKEYVESLKAQVEEHLAKIQAARGEIAEFMNSRDEKEEGKLKKLARFYEAMDPEQASPLLQKVQDELAIQIFDRMDAKKAGGVLALYPPARAAKITAAFPRLKLQMERVADAE
jgi:flagellar motility protein MotE (MotC chaperone)